MKTSSTVVKLIELLQEVRERTLALIRDLDDEQLIGPRLGIVNPLRWEIGHVAWFQEYWVLRHLNHRAPMLDGGDALYDSARVAHETRWDLPLPSKADTISYMQRVLDQVVHLYDRKEKAGEPTDDATYFLSLVLLHEDMHAEAITYTRQTLGYAAPKFKVIDEIARAHSNEPANMDVKNHEPLRNELGDALVPGGTFVLGSTPGKRFVFDNEMSAHEVEVRPFAISRTVVTNAQYAAFVDDGGYDRQTLWCDDGWIWREIAGAKHPVYWRFTEGKWWRRNFDQMVRLEDHLPVLHINWYEAVRRMLSAAGRDVACQPRLNGRWRLVPNRGRMAMESQGTNESFHGAMKHPQRTKLILTGVKWVVSMSDRCPQVIARSVADR